MKKKLLFTLLTGQMDHPETGPALLVSFQALPTDSLQVGLLPPGAMNPKPGAMNKKGAVRSAATARPRKLSSCREHGGLRWAPAAARPRGGGGGSPRPSIRAAAAARGIPFDAVRVPRG